MTIRILATILGSALATFLPRILPFFIRSLSRLEGRLKRVLTIMPVAALGALIFPGVVQTFPERPWAGLFGLAIAVLAAWFVRGLLVPVVAAIIAVFFAFMLPV